MEEASDRLREARRKAGYKTATAASEAFGWPASSYASSENGHRGITATKAQRYARAFGTTAEWLLYGENEPEQVPSPQPHPPKSNTTFMFPVHGSLRGGSEDYLKASDECIDRVTAPPSLVDIKGAYAIYMPGTSMEPRYHEGETLFVNPKKLPRPGEYAAILHTDQPATSSPIWQIGRYERMDAGSRIFSRYNGEELCIPVDKIRAMHKIVATGEW